jgi:hypothetical protein
MEHGWPQSFAVSIMRRVRADLEKEHARILRQDPKALFDEEAIRSNAKAGDWALTNTDPVILTIVSKPGGGPHDRGEPLACSVRRGVSNAMRWAWQVSKGVGGSAFFELATVAHTLSSQLARTEPSYRGRSA